MDDYETKYLRFEFKEHKPKTEVWVVKSKHHGDVLGEIRFYAEWRQYCFIISLEVMQKMVATKNFLVFSRGCHRDIDEFIDRLERELKERRR